MSDVIFDRMTEEDKLKYYLDDTTQVFFSYLEGANNVSALRPAILQIVGEDMIEMLGEWLGPKEKASGSEERQSPDPDAE
jgi:hypothetical protein